MKMATLAEQIKRLFAKPLVQMRNLILLQLVTAVPGSREIHEKIFGNYENQEAPQFQNRNQTVVKLRIQMIWLNNVDCPESKFDGNFMAYYEWNDPRLTWNASEFDFANITVPIDKIWFPKLKFQNINTEGENGDLDEELATVHSDGRVWVLKTFYYVGFCNIESKFYPYDRHYCYIQAMSQGTDVHLAQESNKIFVNPSINTFHTKWLVTDTRSEVTNAIPNNETMLDKNSSRLFNAHILSGEIEVVRRYRHGRMIVVFPLYILGLASLAIFMIPIETGERVGYTIAIHLSMVFTLNLLDSLVPQSANTPLLLDIIFYINFVCIAAFIETTIVTEELHSSEKTVPAWMLFVANIYPRFRNIFTGIFSSKMKSFKTFSNIDDGRRGSLYDSQETHSFMADSMSGLKASEVNCKITRLTFQVSRLRKQLQRKYDETEKEENLKNLRKEVVRKIDQFTFIIAFLTLAGTILYYDHLLTSQYPLKDVKEHI